MSIQHSPLCTPGYNFAERILSQLPKGVAYDIGANEGGFAPWMHRFGMSVFAYEPLLPMVERAKVLNPERDGITYIAKGMDAVARKEVIGVFNTWTLAPANSGHARAKEFLQYEQEVEFVRLDDEVAIHGDPQFIKLDVDGYEHGVLLGGIESLKRCKPTIMMELSYLAKLINQDPSLPLHLLYSIGYRAHSMDGSYCAETFEDAMKCFPWDSSYDVVMVHRDLKYD